MKLAFVPWLYPRCVLPARDLAVTLAMRRSTCEGKVHQWGNRGWSGLFLVFRVARKGERSVELKGQAMHVVIRASIDDLNDWRNEINV